MLCYGYTLTDFPISIRLASLALWQSNDYPSASKATLMNMDKYFMWIHYERLHNHNKAKHNKTVCIYLGIYCSGKAILFDFYTLLKATLHQNPVKAVIRENGQVPVSLIRMKSICCNVISRMISVSSCVLRVGARNSFVVFNLIFWDTFLNKDCLSVYMD